MQRSVNARNDAGLLDGAREGPHGNAHPSRANGTELLFFCPDVTDASTLKRVQQFMDFGYRVTVFGFRRERYNTAYQPPWPNIPLGFTSDARYWHRVRALLGAIPVVTLRPAEATPATLATAIRNVVGEAPVRTGKVKLDVPPLVENGNTVPMTVSVSNPMTSDDYVKSIHVFNEKNPQPNVGNFYLGPHAGRAQISTRIRLADSQKIVAIARLSDDSFWSATVDVVVTLAACTEEVI